MENRFRREKNLLSHAKKIDKEKVQKLEKVEKTSVESPLPPLEELKRTPLEHLSHVYTRLMSHRVLRDTLLLAAVLLVLLASASWLLPRVFSFHIDLWQIVKNMIPSIPGASTAIPDEDVDVLILGRGGFENSAPDLTDSMMIAHYNAHAPVSFTTISIPRDLYVSSKISGTGKINAVYSGAKHMLGEEMAFQHLLDVVNQITGRNIKYYVMLDFTGFRELIDQVGGIDINVPERLYDDTYPTNNYGYTTVDIKPGLQHFDGDKALKYARSRHTTSDFDRSRRQHLVIAALREKMLSLNVLSSPTKIGGIFNVIQSSVQTNMPLMFMINMAKNAIGIPKENIVGYSMDNSCGEVLKTCHPGGLLYTPDKNLFGGASVVLPKKATATHLSVYDDIQRFVKIVTMYPLITEQQPVKVINASGKTNLALNVAIRLRSLGFPVDEAQIANLPTKSDKTFLRYDASIDPTNNIFLAAFSLLYDGEKRPATPEEKATMTWPYELVLGRDASLYF